MTCVTLTLSARHRSCHVGLMTHQAFETYTAVRLCKLVVVRADCAAQWHGGASRAVEPLRARVAMDVVNRRRGAAAGGTDVAVGTWGGLVGVSYSHIVRGHLGYSALLAPL